MQWFIFPWVGPAIVTAMIGVLIVKVVSNIADRHRHKPKAPDLPPRPLTDIQRRWTRNGDDDPARYFLG
jgi:hypothetical protein